MKKVDKLVIEKNDEEITVYSDKRAVMKKDGKEIKGEFIGYVATWKPRVLFQFDDQFKWIWL